MSNPSSGCPLAMQSPALRPRLLLVEDDAGRTRRFTEWLEGSEFVLIAARSGGQAMGVLRQGAHGLAGLMLDHDLSDSPLTSTDASLSTSDLLPLIQRVVPRFVPVLIHSHNVSKPVVMQRALEQAGFSVTRTRYMLLDAEPSRFTVWLQDVRDAWELQQP